MFFSEVLFGAFLTGVIEGRLAYLLFLEIRTAMPWLFGHAEDSESDQVRLLTFCAAATMASSFFAIFDGYSPLWTIFATPFVFTWMSEIILSLHRMFGPVFERFVVTWHPVDILYAGVKRGLGFMWTNRESLSSVPLVGRRRSARVPFNVGLQTPEAPTPSDEAGVEDSEQE